MNAHQTKAKATSEASEEGSFQSTGEESGKKSVETIAIEIARANYYRWRDIANDANRQYRYAAAALARELRAAQAESGTTPTGQSSNRPGHRGDTAATESSTS